jgi:hypothetical protein
MPRLGVQLAAELLVAGCMAVTAAAAAAVIAVAVASRVSSSEISDSACRAQSAGARSQDSCAQQGHTHVPADIGYSGATSISYSQPGVALQLAARYLAAVRPLQAETRPAL